MFDILTYRMFRKDDSDTELKNKNNCYVRYCKELGYIDYFFRNHNTVFVLNSSGNRDHRPIERRMYRIKRNTLYVQCIHKYIICKHIMDIFYLKRNAQIPRGFFVSREYALFN